MRKLDIGIHPLPARPLLLESSRCLVSSTITVSRLASYPSMALTQEDLAYMQETAVGSVDVMPVPPEAAEMELRLAQHLARIYLLGNRNQLSPDDYQAQVLWCQGAAFHEDAVFDCVLAVMLWDGEPRDLVLPHLGVTVPMAPGSVVLLDSAQPHGLLLPGHRTFEPSFYQDSGSRSVFCTLDLPRDLPGLQELMGYDTSPRVVPQDVLQIANDMGVDEASGSWMPARFATASTF